MTGGPTVTGKPELSVIVPVFNESEGIEFFAQELRKAIHDSGLSHEVIFVNDGSSDTTASCLAEIQRNWPEATAIEFTRNFGHMAALSAGLEQSSGHWVGMLDSDMQHPPDVLLAMVQTAKDSGIDVVQGVRTDARESDSLVKRVGSKSYYKLLGRLAGVEITPNAADFRVISGKARDTLIAMPERPHVYRLVLPWLSFPTVLFPFEVQERSAGSSKYSFRRMGSLAWSSIISTSNSPLRLATSVGIITGILALVAVVITIIDYVSGGTVPGWATVIVTVLILSSVQLLTIGVLGEYLGALLNQVRGRPEYVANPDGPPFADHDRDPRTSSKP